MNISFQELYDSYDYPSEDPAPTYQDDTGDHNSFDTGFTKSKQFL